MLLYLKKCFLFVVWAYFLLRFVSYNMSISLLFFVYTEIYWTHIVCFSFSDVQLLIFFEDAHFYTQNKFEN